MGALFFKKGKERLENVPVTFWECKATDINGKDMPMQIYKGSKAILIVNVASAWGLTNKQYKGLVALYEQFREKGLEILAFPCNQFMKQEDKCELDIKTYVTKKFGVKFPLFSKVEVNGADCHPLYKYLRRNSVLYDKKKSTMQDIPWNFAKFVIDQEGNVVKLYAPDVRPEELVRDIQQLL